MIPPAPNRPLKNSLQHSYVTLRTMTHLTNDVLVKRVHIKASGYLGGAENRAALSLPD